MIDRYRALGATVVDQKTALEVPNMEFGWQRAKLLNQAYDLGVKDCMAKMQAEHQAETRMLMENGPYLSDSSRSAFIGSLAALTNVIDFCRKMLHYA